MTSPNKIVIPLLRSAVLAFLCVTSAISQIRQINPTKLPQDLAVQHAYSDLLPIEQFARTSESTWRFPVPRDQVVARFRAALHTLEAAQKQAPANKELQLLTGLVVHLAYNLGIIEEIRSPAIELLQPLANEDFRAAWFLGMQQCQSDEPVNGMRRLLYIETSTATLPGAFWQDYAICAGIANMPMHAVRAFDNANKAADSPPIDAELEQTARSRIKASSLTASYPARQAWYPQRTARGNQVASTLCGESFITKPTSHLNIRDAGFGTCIITIDTEQYPSRYGPSSASLLVGTQAAKPGESLEAFAKRTFEAFSNAKLKDPGEANRTSVGIHCPVATCLTFEVVTDKLYKGEGGAHLLAVFFQSEQPAYPGLRFETPQPTSSPNSSQPGFLRPTETLQRYNGTLYSFVTLDANLDIYPRSRVDFDDLLKSIVVDSK